MKSAKEKLAKKAYDHHMDDNKHFARHYAQRALSMGSKIRKKERMAKEEVEHLDEGKLDKMTLSGLWHKHAEHIGNRDFYHGSYGTGSDSSHLHHHAATAIENHVRKHHGNKVADDMVSHSDHESAGSDHHPGSSEREHHDAASAKLKQKHNIHESVNEMWPGTPEYKAKFGDKFKQEQGGGSGVKKGHRYGGANQKSKPEHDDETKKVSEDKDPNMDAGCGSQPNFATDGGKVAPISKAKELAKSSMKRLKKESMLGKAPGNN
jgi:hypothetical protein